MARVKLSPAARSDLVGVRKYSNEQFSSDVADSYFLGFDQVFALLRLHPLAGQEKPDLGRDIRCFTHRKHRVMYRIQNDLVLIIRIIHSAQDAKRALN